MLSGAVIPLALLPWGLGDVLEWLPFASLAWAPLSIYTGIGDAPRLIALQVFWALRALAARGLAVAREPREGGRLWWLSCALAARVACRACGGCTRAWICSGSRAARRSRSRGTSRDLLLALGSAVWAFLLAERFDGIGAWTQGAGRVPARARAVRARRGRLRVQLQHRIARAGASARGQLDHMLLMPQPLWVTIASDGFMPFSCSGTLIAGSGRDRSGRCTRSRCRSASAGSRCSRCTSRRRR